jgi:hypothetical protein
MGLMLGVEFATRPPPGVQRAAFSGLLVLECDGPLGSRRRWYQPRPSQHWPHPGEAVQAVAAS